MKKEVLVISVGGSVIIPKDKADDFLLQLRKVLKKHYSTHKFVLVCGGGSVARAYINILSKEHKNHKEQSTAGIRATRMNAELVMQVFGKEANAKLPSDMKSVKSELHKNSVVVCGALRYADHQTSDTTAAKLAAYLKSDFVNLTNVPGLYTSDPRIHKDAKLITNITWKEFENKSHLIKFKPGEHFVLDQKAATLIKKHKIPTAIIGKNAKNLDAYLKNKKWKGTRINAS